MNALAACCHFSIFIGSFLLSARETSPGNRYIYKSTRERVDFKGLYGRCRLYLMGSCIDLFFQFPRKKSSDSLSVFLPSDTFLQVPILRQFVQWTCSWKSSDMALSLTDWATNSFNMNEFDHHILALLKPQRERPDKLRPARRFESWPLRCRCRSARPVELSGQLGAGCYVGQLWARRCGDSDNKGIFHSLLLS